MTAAVKGLHELGQFLPGGQMAETDAEGAETVELVRRKAGSVGAGEVKGDLADGLRGVHMQAAGGEALQDGGICRGVGGIVEIDRPR